MFDKLQISYLYISFYDIVLIKPDKRNGVVVLNKANDENGLLTSLNVNSKFKILSEDPTIKRERQLKRFVCNLNKEYKDFLLEMSMKIFILRVQYQEGFMVCQRCIKPLTLSPLSDQLILQ